MAPATEVEPRFDPFLGQMVGGRYKIAKLLGEGGMGAVYLGEQNIGGTVRKVAIKTLHAHLSKDPKILQRFERECATVAELQHPNTIQLYDFGKTDDGILYMVMEYVQGESLAAVLEKQGSLEPSRTLHILQQICDALGEAHTLGIVHRDLKPENIVLTERAKDWVKVLDFGIAKRSEAAQDKSEQRLTQQGTVLGTPPYMSPEQFTGKPIDARSDLYSIAVIAYEMLSGRLPFTAATPWEWATQHMQAAPQPLSLTPSGAPIPDAMVYAVMRSLAKDPNDRFATTREFYDALSTPPTLEVRAVSGGFAAAPPSMIGAAPGGGTPAPFAPFPIGGVPAPLAPAGVSEVYDPGALQAGNAVPTTERGGKTQLGEPTGAALAPTPGVFAPPQPSPDVAPGPYGTPAAGALAVPPAPRRGRGAGGAVIALLGFGGLLAAGGIVFALTSTHQPSARTRPPGRGAEPPQTTGTADAGAEPTPTNDSPGKGRLPPLIDTALPSLPINIDPGHGAAHHADAGAAPGPIPSATPTPPTADPHPCKVARNLQARIAESSSPTQKMYNSFNAERAKCISAGGHL